MVALISTSIASPNHGEIVKFAQGLGELGHRLITTSWTNSFLLQAGVESESIATFTQLEPIEDLEVVNPVLAAALMFEPAKLQLLDIEPIDLVCVDSRSNHSLSDGWHKSDVLTQWLVHAAIYGQRLIIRRPSQYEPLLSWLQSDLPNRAKVVKELAIKAMMDDCIENSRLAQVNQDIMICLNLGRQSASLISA